MRDPAALTEYEALQFRLLLDLYNRWVTGSISSVSYQAGCLIVKQAFEEAMFLSSTNFPIARPLSPLGLEQELRASLELPKEEL